MSKSISHSVIQTLSSIIAQLSMDWGSSSGDTGFLSKLIHTFKSIGYWILEYVRVKAVEFKYDLFGLPSKIPRHPQSTQITIRAHYTCQVEK